MLKHISNFLPKFTLINEKPQLPPFGKLDEIPPEWKNQYEQSKKKKGA